MNSITSAIGAISTPHYLATEAGAHALRAGGNAIDAALAAAATLCVVYPNNVALGGDLVALVRNPDGEVRFLNATGTAPAAQTLEDMREKHGEQLPLRGVDTITVPGGVRGWAELHTYGANRSWAEHLESATMLAEQGFPNSRSVAAALVSNRATLERDPGAKEIFYPDGEPIAEGKLVVQPALAESFKKLAANGAATFYEGELAQQWIAGLSAMGSTITPDDTAAYRASWGEALEGSFSGLRILTGPPNTSGFMLLRALNAISGADGGPGIEDPLGAGAGALARAFQDANRVRSAALADPRFGGATGEELVTMPVPGGRFQGAGKATGDTVGFTATSADGWAVSLINSVYWGFGAHILEPSTGIVFQNRGTAFSLDPDSPNALAPGKRPQHTLMPVLVFDGDELAWVPATMGGPAQPQIHAHLLLRVLAGATPQAATSAPRWIVNELRGGRRASVRIEEDVSEAARASILDAGFELDVVAPHHEGLGHSNLIRVLPDGFEAASDPRSDGAAIVVPSDRT